MDSLENEKLNTPTTWLSHYNIEEITISTTHKRVTFKIDTNEKYSNNSDKKQLQILKEINLLLLNIEDSKWKSNNMKFMQQSKAIDTIMDY